MKKLSLLTILFFSFSFGQAFAQFEGKIQINTYEMESGEKVKDDDSFTLFVTADRIFLTGDKGYKVRGQFEAEGIMVRQKEKDFVFLTGKDRAMQITKAGITSFINLFGGDTKGNGAQSESNIKVTNTGETKTVDGYVSEKFIITDKKNPQVHSEAWMTKGIDINWGILAESWSDNMQGFTGSDLPLNIIFDDGYFPIRWEQYKNDEMTLVSEAEVTKTDIARSMVEISPDVQIVNLQQYMIQQMRKNQ